MGLVDGMPAELIRAGLRRAAGNGHARVVRALVESGADANASDLQNYSVLHEATWCRRVDVVRALVHFGADVHRVDKWGNTPIGTHMPPQTWSDSMLRAGSY